MRLRPIPSTRLTVRRWLVRAASACAAAMVCIGATAAHAAYYDAAVATEASESIASADYRLWIADDLPKVRAVIIRQHGCGGGAADVGLSLSQDVQWQAFARKHEAALLSTRLLGRGGSCAWTDPRGGSARTLIAALKDLAAQSGRPELAEVPWLIQGHSGGGYWATAMAAMYPDRVLAAAPCRSRAPWQIDNPAATNRGQLDAGLAGVIGQHPPARFAEVPILFAVGRKDTLINPIDPAADFQRRSNALWTLTVEAEAAHEVGMARQIIMPFFEAVIAQRLAEDGTVRPMDRTRAWGGDPKSLEISAASGGEVAEETCYLPDEAFARSWQQFMKNGWLPVAVTAPEAPAEVRVERISRTEVQVTWTPVPASADQPPVGYQIFRDGVQIGQVAAQKPGFHDNPEPPVARPVYRDISTAGIPAGAVYSVVAHRGIHRSAPALAAAVGESVTPAEARPDLVITDVTLFRQQPGEVDVRLTVKNTGSAATPPGVGIGARVRVDSQAVLVPIVRQPLAPGESIVLDSSRLPGRWAVKVESDTVPVTAMIDELDRIEESDESNNSIDRRIAISGAAP